VFFGLLCYKGNKEINRYASTQLEALVSDIRHFYGFEEIVS